MHCGSTASSLMLQNLHSLDLVNPHFIRRQEFQRSGLPFLHGHEIDARLVRKENSTVLRIRGHQNSFSDVRKIQKNFVFPYINIVSSCSSFSFSAWKFCFSIIHGDRNKEKQENEENEGNHNQLVQNPSTLLMSANMLNWYSRQCEFYLWNGGSCWTEGLQYCHVS